MLYIKNKINRTRRILSNMFQEIRSRRSIRKYIDKPIEDEKIMEIIESARLAHLVLIHSLGILLW